MAFDPAGSPVFAIPVGLGTSDAGTVLLTVFPDGGYAADLLHAGDAPRFSLTIDANGVRHLLADWGGSARYIRGTAGGSYDVSSSVSNRAALAVSPGGTAHLFVERPYAANPDGGAAGSGVEHLVRGPTNTQFDAGAGVLFLDSQFDRLRTGFSSDGKPSLVADLGNTFRWAEVSAGSWSASEGVGDGGTQQVDAYGLRGATPVVQVTRKAFPILLERVAPGSWTEAPLGAPGANAFNLTWDRQGRGWFISFVFTGAGQQVRLYRRAGSVEFLVLDDSPAASPEVADGFLLALDANDQPHVTFVKTVISTGAVTSLHYVTWR